MFVFMPKLRISTLMTLTIILLGTGASSQDTSFAASGPASEPPLRTSEPVGDIVADLASGRWNRSRNVLLDIRSAMTHFNAQC